MVVPKSQFSVSESVRVKCVSSSFSFTTFRKLAGRTGTDDKRINGWFIMSKDE